MCEAEACNEEKSVGFERSNSCTSIDEKGAKKIVVMLYPTLSSIRLTEPFRRLHPHPPGLTFPSNRPPIPPTSSPPHHPHEPPPRPHPPLRNRQPPPLTLPPLHPLPLPLPLPPPPARPLPLPRHPARLPHDAPPDAVRDGTLRAGRIRAAPGRRGRGDDPVPAQYREDGV